jgi:hypothetical protein
LTDQKKKGTENIFKEIVVETEDKDEPEGRYVK